MVAERRVYTPQSMRKPENVTLTLPYPLKRIYSGAYTRTGNSETRTTAKNESGKVQECGNVNVYAPFGRPSANIEVIKGESYEKKRSRSSSLA